MNPVLGAAGRTAARPLVLLHGFLGDKTDWRAFTSACGDPQRTLALDLPGHGNEAQAVPLPTTLDEAAQAMARQLDAEGVERCDVLGYSLGGRVALALAAREPARIERLVLVGAATAPPEDRAARRARDATLAARLEHEGLASFLNTWYAQPLFDSLRASPAYADMLARRARGDARALAALLVALSPADQPDFSESLLARTAPTLLVAGAEDETYLARYRALAARAPHLECAAIPGAGHAVLLEAPARLASVVERFLAG